VGDTRAQRRFGALSMQYGEGLGSSLVVGSRANWEELLPQILSSYRPLTYEMSVEALLSVAKASERGDITQPEVELLVKRIINVLVEQELNAVISRLAPRAPYGSRRGGFVHAFRRGHRYA
jgi:hypothetical protein